MTRREEGPRKELKEIHGRAVLEGSLPTQSARFQGPHLVGDGHA